MEGPICKSRWSICSDQGLDSARLVHGVDRGYLGGIGTEVALCMESYIVFVIGVRAGSEAYAHSVSADCIASAE